MILVFVPHGAKVTGVTQYDRRLASDPPMTMEGKGKVIGLADAIRGYGPFDGVFSSTMDRACGSMCTIANALGFQRVVCLASLGQRANLDADGTIIQYPGFEAEDNPIAWQNQVFASIGGIKREIGDRGFENPEQVVLVFSHRPILAAMVAASRGITDAPGIQDILNDKATVGPGFRVFRISDDGQITISLLE